MAIQHHQKYPKNLKRPPLEDLYYSLSNTFSLFCCTKLTQIKYTPTVYCFRYNTKNTPSCLTALYFSFLLSAFMEISFKMYPPPPHPRTAAGFQILRSLLPSIGAGDRSYKRQKERSVFTVAVAQWSFSLHIMGAGEPQHAQGSVMKGVWLSACGRMKGKSTLWGAERLQTWKRGLRGWVGVRCGVITCLVQEHDWLTHDHWGVEHTDCHADKPLSIPAWVTHIIKLSQLRASQMVRFLCYEHFV